VARNTAITCNSAEGRGAKDELTLALGGEACEERARTRGFAPQFVPAGIAQLVEQLICNQQVIGSSPIAGSSRTEQAFPFG
jgi:hypothetical protein